MTTLHIHTKDDLRAASIVWIERRHAIQKLLLKENPHLSEVDVVSIVQGCCLYATCGDDLFEQVTAGVPQ